MPLLKDKSHEFEIEALGYITQRQFSTLIRLVIDLLNDKDDELIGVLNMDLSALEGVLVDYVRVSLMVTTDHPINAFFTTPTTDKAGFKADFLEFANELKHKDNGAVFGELVEAVAKFQKDNEHKAPTPPTDPN